MNIDTMHQDQMDAMPYDELVKLAQGVNYAAPGEAAETARAQQPTETPREERQEEQQQQAVQPQHVETPVPVPAPEATPAPEAQRGDPEVPLRHAREQARQALEAKQAVEQAHQQAIARQAELENHLKGWQQFAQDPEALRAHLATVAPGPAPDFDVDPQAAIQHHLAPIMNELSSVKAELAQTKAQRAQESAAAQAQQAQQARMAEVAQKHGPDVHSLIPAFDQANPHYAHLDPEARLMMARGLQAASAAQANPAAEQARIKALADQQTDAQLAAILMGGPAPRGIPTLGAAPTGREEQSPVNLDSVGQGDMEKMSIADLQKLVRPAG